MDNTKKSRVLKKLIHFLICVFITYHYIFFSFNNRWLHLINLLLWQIVKFSFVACCNDLKMNIKIIDKRRKIK